MVDGSMDLPSAIALNRSPASNINSTMNTITTTSPIELTRTKRVLRFVLAAIPGALIVGVSGSLLVEAGTNGKDIWFSSFLGFAFLFGCGLLLHGTRTAHEPLVLLMFAPIAMLIPYGYQVDY